MRLLYNATFFSMDEKNTKYSAILVDQEKIIDVFMETPHLPDAEKIDLEGCFVFPGFIDTHTHSFQGGLYSFGADLSSVETIEELLSLLSETDSIDDKIFAFNFDENAIKEKRFPTASELDTIFPDTPVFLRRIDGHSCVLNSLAIKLVPWREYSVNISQGLFKGAANDEAAHWFHQLSNEGILMAYHKASLLALKKGHTTIHTMIGDARNDPEHYELIRDNLSQFAVDFILYPQIFDISKALELGAIRIGGCILADGSFGSHTAALKDEYIDQPGKGILYQTDSFWQKFIKEAHEANLQVGVHVIGDAAIEQILTAYESAQKYNPKPLRHQLIHNELISAEMIKRASRTGVAAVMQPMFDKLWGGTDQFYAKVLGKKRAENTNPLRSLLKENVLTTGSSDWYVTELNALKGIDAAVNLHNINERLTPLEAIRLYTTNAALLSGDENNIGMIKAGMQADLVCLSDNILEVEEIGKSEIIYVIKKGKVVKHLS